MEGVVELSTKIFFVRRGRTYENLPEKARGHRKDFTLSALTDEGRLQADLIAKQLKTVDFDRIYVSPYFGAIETAILISDYLNPKIALSVDDRLTKRGVGVHIPRAVPSRVLWDYHYAETQSLDGEETLLQMEKRLSDFLACVLVEHSNKNVLVVSHGGVARVFRAVVEGRPQSGNLLDFPYLEYGEFVQYAFEDWLVGAGMPSFK